MFLMSCVFRADGVIVSSRSAAVAVGTPSGLNGGDGASRAVSLMPSTVAHELRNTVTAIASGLLDCFPLLTERCRLSSVLDVFYFSRSVPSVHQISRWAALQPFNTMSYPFMYASYIMYVQTSHHLPRMITTCLSPTHHSNLLAFSSFAFGRCRRQFNLRYIIRLGFAIRISPKHQQYFRFV